MLFSRRAQTIMEYMIILTVVTTAVVVMLPRIKRSTQSLIKTAADQIGDQAGAEQTFNDYKVGYLNSMGTSTKTQINNLRRDVYGEVEQNYDETVITNTKSTTYMGWSPN